MISTGRIVHYRLSKSDAERITTRRASNSLHGNPVTEGDVVPLIVSKVWPDEYGAGVPGVNGQAFLDGADQLWVTSAKEGPEPGQWMWPPRA